MDTSQVIKAHEVAKKKHTLDKLIEQELTTLNTLKQ